MALWIREGAPKLAGKPGPQRCRFPGSRAPGDTASAWLALTAPPHPRPQQAQDRPLPLLRTWLLGTVTVFGVSQRQENKESTCCQCDSDLENPEKGKSWLPASKGGRPPAGGHRGRLALLVPAAEFLLFSLIKVLGISVCGPAWNPATLIEGGEMLGALLFLWLGSRRHGF